MAIPPPIGRLAAAACLAVLGSIAEAQTPVRLDLREGAARGYLIDYVDGWWILERGTERQKVEEADVLGVAFLDGRLGDPAPAETEGWARADLPPVPAEARARVAVGRRGTTTLDANDPYTSFVERERPPAGRHLRLESGTALRFSAGFAGYDFGHFIDLGEVPFEEVRVDETGLRLPVPADTYALFAWWTDARPMYLQPRADVIAGHVYLVRSFEEWWDGVLKLRVAKIDPDGVTFDWEVLAEYDLAAMRARHVFETRRALMPGKRLSCRLYWRASYRDYPKATVNFALGTRDAVHFAKNDWSLELSGTRPMFVVHMVTDDRSGLVDLGERPLEDAGIGEARKSPLRPEAPVVPGHVYAVHTQDRESDYWTRFRVLEFTPGGTVRLEWEVFPDRRNEENAERYREYHRKQMEAFDRAAELFQGKDPRRKR